MHENLVDPALFPSGKQKLLEEIVAGVRWNDDPLSLLQSKLLDFTINFTHSCGEKISAKTGPAWDLLYRTHCGDMQYLHAMASSSTETQEVTVNKMMMWLEFTYKVSTGSITENYRLRCMHKNAKLSEKSRKLTFVAPWLTSGFIHTPHSVSLKPAAAQTYRPS